MLSPPPLAPCASFDQALRAYESLRALDGPEILPQAQTTLLHHGKRTGLCVLLLHGFTNHPGQYRQFAPLVFERGANVLVPRMPEHGDANRLTTRLKHLTAEMLLGTAAFALDIAGGLGRRVCVLGISSSGLLAALLALYRGDVYRAISVAPEFAILDFSRRTTRGMEALMRTVPDMMMWWDPRVKNGMHPITAYPRFSTRALGQTLRLADAVFEGLEGRTPAAPLVAVVNPQDPAVNNLVTRDVIERWRQNGTAADIEAIDGLPRNHDIIEPDNPKAATNIVYPQLLRRIFSLEQTT